MLLVTFHQFSAGLTTEGIDCNSLCCTALGSAYNEFGCNENPLFANRFIDTKIIIFGLYIEVLQTLNLYVCVAATRKYHCTH